MKATLAELDDIKNQQNFLKAHKSKEKNIAEIQKRFLDHLHLTLAKDRYSATQRDLYFALAYTVRDQLMARWIETQQKYYNEDRKRVYYLSLEFLIGRSLGNNLLNLNVYEECTEALKELGIDLESLREMEEDAGLGNGGLGRLAACFLDSMASLDIAGYGYGIRYEFGIFFQRIRGGEQIEVPDNWLRYGNPWEIARPEFLYPVHFYGRVESFTDPNGKQIHNWHDTEEVMALAYDTPVPGYKNNTVNTLRLWSAKSSREFIFTHFNEGDYERAVEHRNKSENISKILYPNDHFEHGKELRLKQQYFLVSATLQDIIRRYKKNHNNFDKFKEKVALQLNDTHPTLAIPELMRLLIDKEGLEWEKAWKITQSVSAYTNHTLLPEALETWSVSLLERLLPRHMQIIYEINQKFLQSLPSFPCYKSGDEGRMSIIEEDMEKKVRMANLAIIGSHHTNGVSKLHTDLLKQSMFPEFNRYFGDRMIPLTNGITPRRWLFKANPALTQLICEAIGEKWMTDFTQLKKLADFAHDKAFHKKWNKVKLENKKRLAQYINDTMGIKIDPKSLFDVQIKRLHEYKRQLMNVFHAIHLYHDIKANPKKYKTPRTILFGGKAAPGYYTAKMIIKLICYTADMINKDPEVSKLLKVVFLENYRVSLAEKMIPAADLSEQISTAGMEASGTGNMKFALNGALTIGTLDGANVEIKDAVGDENIFIFGLKANEVESLKKKGYNPWDFYHQDEDLKKIIFFVQGSQSNNLQFHSLTDNLLHHGDPYFVLADFASYRECQEEVMQCFENPEAWTTKAILNVANMGCFSSDYTISKYAKEIWQV